MHSTRSLQFEIIILRSLRSLRLCTFNNDITAQLLLTSEHEVRADYKEKSRDPLGGNESQPFKHMPRQNYVKITPDLGHRVTNLELLANVSRIYRHLYLLTRDHTFHRTL